MFKKKREYHKRKAFLPVVIFRMILSLTMFAILGLGIYQAYKNFTGTDPLKMDPQAVVNSVLSSEDSVNIINTLFGFSLTKDLAAKMGQPEKPEQIIQETGRRPKASGKLLFKFAVMADSHNDINNLSKALKQAKAEGARYVIGLGDYSNVGTVGELQQAKDVFDASGLSAYHTAGDHDLWDPRNRGIAPITNFSDVFGAPYHTFSDSNVRFVILSNGDNYLGIDGVQEKWLEDTLRVVRDESEKGSLKTTFVFLHEPLYHPSSDHMMGKEEPGLKKQAERVAESLAQAKVGEVFAGDIHAFSQYNDPKSGLKMTTVGALTSERNTQKPRFIMVDVFEDGSYNIEDKEL